MDPHGGGCGCREKREDPGNESRRVASIMFGAVGSMTLPSMFVR